MILLFPVIINFHFPQSFPISFQDIMADMCGPGHEPYKILDRLQLRCYLPHEIEKISVLRITETKTFDEVCNLDII